MKIYTKTGDKGQTSLIGGTRVLKSSLRIEAYGTVDELNSWIGVLRDHDTSHTHTATLLEIQDRLFTIGAILASEPGKSKMKIPELHDTDVEFLEAGIDALNESLPEMKSFVLPGGHPSVSFCHVARCVCRRSERICVDLSQNEEVAEIVIRYLNRLSDYLFVLSRKLSQDQHAIESPWKPRM
ncbi:MAG TPA: cob(I)yrinic acid a,c-diamide adenosyltransferase [Flavobacteriales bacterium]|nr:cob(I)yrinic acid a,c-diamide adenosyltransferase [Flavobacteriales bacterium]HRE76086.1 cob(I)yrinic acid a,c-diamide adenosyltransferase [Flavobacteriales bacterium]HRE97062.1 cob(I)yrinic acid a,c-diamide adenosyltransferase [Flavobacteriales bacterium]HRJ35203.1 cob(I)yrinic acid a,c-diamide adenosyltransferase [Flavobacteriales bacterium]HRJ39399.1 cob(I)yrinic acid a,c-diamide adenosyltransferase [Flavobacteriales bacterium]